MKYDIIIIGAGLGGLTAGAKLSKEGRKVLVIEQHNRPGGCATTFQRGDYTLEVGLHEMDGPGPRDMKNRVFADLEVNENVQFVRIPEFYRFVNERCAITVPHDPEKAISVLSESFPAETTGIKAYFDQVLNRNRKAADAVPDQSIGTFLDSVITNDDLKLVLLGNLGYFADDPYTLSLAYYCAAQSSYYTGGSSFIRGGSQVLSDHLAAFIERKGGRVLLSHTAMGLKTEGSRIKGVAIRNRSDKNIFEAEADEIIAGCALQNISELLPGQLQSALNQEISGYKTGSSLLSVYYGFRRPLRELGHKYYSTFIYDSSVKSPGDIGPNNRADFTERSFTFVDYGQIDSGLASGSKSVGAVCCTDYLADWEGLSREAYKTRKKQVEEAFTSRMDMLIPGFRDAVGYCEVGTAATVKRFTMNPEGAVYGFRHLPGEKPVDQIRSVDNLHVASAWGKTGGGFSGVILGGYLCAYNILRKKN